MSSEEEQYLKESAFQLKWWKKKTRECFKYSVRKSRLSGFNELHALTRTPFTEEPKKINPQRCPFSRQADRILAAKLPLQGAQECAQLKV